MLSLLGFGKKTRKSSKMSAKMPSAKLLKLAKKVGVRPKTKRGSKRVWKSAKTLKKQIVKKLKAMKKGKKMSPKRKVSKRKATRHYGRKAMNVVEFGRRGMSKARAFGAFKNYYGLSRFGASSLASRAAPVSAFGKKRRVVRKMSKKSKKSMKKASGKKLPKKVLKMAKKAGVKVSTKKGKKRVYKSLKAVMKQIKKKMRTMKKKPSKKSKKGGKKSKKVTRRTRRRFGRRSAFGESPSLMQMMGYDFCTEGGGVLGPDSTGLYGSPCKAPAEKKVM